MRALPVPNQTEDFVYKKVGPAANFARIACAILVGIALLYSRIFLSYKKVGQTANFTIY